MKAIYILLVLSIFAFGNKNTQAQVIAIGHICAEVIESVSISSLTITDLIINRNSTNSTINMGKVKINSSDNVVTNVLINQMVNKHLVLLRTLTLQ